MQKTNNRVRLVMVHGLLGSLTFYEPDKYLKGVELISPELHGYGDAGAMADPSLQDQVDYIHEELRGRGGGLYWLLGHSVGGAIANIFAARYPELVAGVISVEGNFSLNDAFWCKQISAMSIGQWKAEYHTMTSDPAKWLQDSGIEITPERTRWAKEILSFQSAETVHAVATAVVKETDSEQYKQVLGDLIERETPYFLISGEHSRKEWDVPETYEKHSKEITIDGVGHMMMLENPRAFCRAIADIVS